MPPQSLGIPSSYDRLPPQSLQVPSPYERQPPQSQTEDARFSSYPSSQRTAIEAERQKSISRHPSTKKATFNTKTRINLISWIRTVRPLIVDGIEYLKVLLPEGEAHKLGEISYQILVVR